MEPKWSPDEKPAFLDADRADSIGYVGADAVPAFDSELAALPELDTELPARGKGPSRGYEDRWREIARLHALGYTNNQIARHLGYSAPGISLALSKPFVQAEVVRMRNSLVSEDAIAIMKDTSVYAARRLQKAVMDPSDKNGYDAAKFVTEKVTGKAKQEVAVGTGDLSSFIELLKVMQNRGEVLDVTPAPQALAGTSDVKEDAPQESEIDTWLARNL